MKDNRPPKEERTLKRGDTREDGMVFCGYRATCKNGERWVTADKMKEVIALRLAGDRRHYEKVRKTPKFIADRKRYAWNYYHLRGGKETAARSAREYVAENRDCYNTYQRRWTRERRASDAGWRVQQAMRTRLWRAIKVQKSSKSANTMDLAGCTIDELMEHLESQFTDGMTWDNHGRYGWHIDHIKPCAAFDLTLDSEQRECFHYSNLQPLWAEDNLKKSDNWNGF